MSRHAAHEAPPDEKSGMQDIRVAEPEHAAHDDTESTLQALDRETGADSTLSKYFREMANHRVLTPKEEVEAAKEVERLEIGYWEALFSYAPAFETVASVLERHVAEEPLPAEVARAAQARAAPPSRASCQEGPAEALGRARARGSRTKLRVLDTDRIFVDRVRPRRAPPGRRCTRPSATSRATTVRITRRFKQLPGAASSARSVRSSDAQEPLRHRQPAPRGVDRAPLQPRPPAADRPDPGGQHRPDEGGRALRPHARLPLLHLRVVVDPPRDQPRARRQGPRGAHPGAHARHVQPRGARHAGHHRRAPASEPTHRGAREGDRHPARQAREGARTSGPRRRSRSTARSATRTAASSSTSSRTRTRPSPYENLGEPELERRGAAPARRRSRRWSRASSAGASASTTRTSSRSRRSATSTTCRASASASSRSRRSARSGARSGSNHAVAGRGRLRRGSQRCMRRTSAASRVSAELASRACCLPRTPFARR